MNLVRPPLSTLNTSPLHIYLTHHRSIDGEGSIHRRRLTAYNTDRKLLAYIKGLPKEYFDIDATGPHLSQKSGRVIHSHGKVYKSNKDCYYVYVRSSSLPRFYEGIGFTIQRKQRRLADAAKQ